MAGKDNGVGFQLGKPQLQQPHGLGGVQESEGSIGPGQGKEVREGEHISRDVAHRRGGDQLRRVFSEELFRLVQVQRQVLFQGKLHHANPRPLFQQTKRTQDGVVLVRGDIGRVLLPPVLALDDLVQGHGGRGGKDRLRLASGVAEADELLFDIPKHGPCLPGGPVCPPSRVHRRCPGEEVRSLMDAVRLGEGGGGVVQIDHRRHLPFSNLIHYIIITN